MRRVHRGRAFGGRAVGAASEPIVSAFAATDATVYAATDDGVFQSPDGGGTWQAVSAGLADLHVYALALDRSQSSRLRPSRASADAVRRGQRANSRALERPNLDRLLAGLTADHNSAAAALVQTQAGIWRGSSESGRQRRGDRRRFGIASTTKTFIATVVLQLVDEGRLSLDDLRESAP